MPVTINGDGSITGLAVGGLPDGCVDADTLAAGAAVPADGSITTAKLASGAITAATLPAGTIIKYQNTTGGSSNQNVNVNQSWTTLTGTIVDFTPTFSNSKLDMNWNFTIENQAGINGLHFRIYRQSPIGGSDIKIFEMSQHSHWATGLADWSGPGTIYLHHNDTPGVTTPVRYFVQAYKEAGNNMYINYGSDADGINMTIREVKQ